MEISFELQFEDVFKKESPNILVVIIFLNITCMYILYIKNTLDSQVTYILIDFGRKYLTMFWDILSAFLNAWSLQMGLIGCPETPVTDYQTCAD
jgi:hypothetical protein